MVKKKTSHNPPPTPGERLKAIRTFVQSIRKEFCKKTGISEHTLRSLEKNTVPLTRNGALRICELLATEGILCTPEWLLKGIGTPPLTQESIKRKFTQTFGEKEVEEDNVIAAEADNFLKKYSQSIVMVVLDNAMYPQFQRGDYLGGEEIPPSQLETHLKKACIIELDDPQGTFVRTLEKGRKPHTFSLSCLNPMEAIEDPFFTDPKMKTAYEILWFRRKKTVFHK